MIHMLKQAPVSPDSPLEAGGVDDATLKDQLGAAQDEVVDFKQAMMDAPYVGVELLQHEEDGPCAIPAKPVPNPPTMSAAEKATHDLTHQPPHPGCAICKPTKSPNMQHPQSHEHMRTIPLLVG